MFSIEKNKLYNKSFVINNDFDSHLCTLINLDPRITKHHLKNILELIDFIRKYELVVINIDPSFDYSTVSLFQKENVHILRLSKKEKEFNYPLFLSNKDELLSIIKKDNQNNIDLSLELFVPMCDNIFLPNKYFNYTTNNKYIIVTTTKENEIEIKEFFKNMLGLNNVIFLINDYEMNIAKFINSDTICFSQNNKSKYYKENLDKLNVINKICNIPFIDKKINYLDFIIREKYLIIPKISLFHDKDVNNLFSQYSGNIFSFNFKELELIGDIEKMFCFLPYANIYKIKEEEKEVEKKFKIKEKK